MLLFLPAALLVLTLLALGASNLQRGFRSNWLLALAGASLAWLSLLFLRLQLPLSAGIPAWWAGKGLGYSATFILDEISWTLVFAVCSLLVAALLGQVHRAMSAAWYSWAPTLVIGAAAILSVLSGDLLTFVFTWAFLDILTFTLLAFQLSGAAERRAAMQLLPQNFLAIFLLMAAWALSFYGQDLSEVLVFMALGLRLGLWVPQNKNQGLPSLRDGQQLMLVLVPLAASLSLAARFETPAEPWVSILSLLVLLPSTYSAAKWLWPSQSKDLAYWKLGFAGLTAAAALNGSPAAALGYALVLLLGLGLLDLVQLAGRYRPLAAVLGALLLCGLPLTVSNWTSNLIAKPVSPVAFVFLFVQAGLIAGWLRRATQGLGRSAPPEPWMQTIEWIGLFVQPVALLALGLGLLPYLGTKQPSLPLWPALLIAGASGAIFLFIRNRESLPGNRVWKVADFIFSLRWLQQLESLAVGGMDAFLKLLGELLEGRAGILWAMLLMALLLSLVAQVGLAG